MSTSNLDRRWDEIARLIDEIARIRADRRAAAAAPPLEAAARRSYAVEARSRGAVVFSFPPRRLKNG
jgi:hypothetical protein